MSEKPIIFNTEMVKAILDGRKTVTRRLIKPQPPEEWNSVKHIKTNAGIIGWCFYNSRDPDNHSYKKNIPYKKGDILWVKEGWRCTGGGSERNIIYKADGDTAISFCGVDDGRKSILHVAEPYWAEWDRLVYKTDKGCEWRSARFMPKWAARIRLEVLHVNIESLEEITGAECVREGCPTLDTDDRYKAADMAHEWFERLWDSLYAKRGYPYESNPWVWPLEFKIENVLND